MTSTTPQPQTNERSTSATDETAAESSFWRACGGFSAETAEHHASQIRPLWEVGALDSYIAPTERLSTPPKPGEWSSDTAPNKTVKTAAVVTAGVIKTGVRNGDGKHAAKSPEAQPPAKTVSGTREQIEAKPDSADIKSSADSKSGAVNENRAVAKEPVEPKKLNGKTATKAKSKAKVKSAPKRKAKKSKTKAAAVNHESPNAESKASKDGVKENSVNDVAANEASARHTSAHESATKKQAASAPKKAPRGGLRADTPLPSIMVDPTLLAAAAAESATNAEPAMRMDADTTADFSAALQKQRRGGVFAVTGLAVILVLLGGYIMFGSSSDDTTMVSSYVPPTESVDNAPNPAAADTVDNTQVDVASNQNVNTASETDQNEAPAAVNAAGESTAPVAESPVAESPVAESPVAESPLAAATPIPEATAETPAAPRIVEHSLQITTSPAEATLRIDGETVANPFEANFERGTRLRLRAEAEGYRPVTRRIRIQRDTTLSLELRPTRRTVRRNRPAASRSRAPSPARRRTPRRARPSRSSSGVGSGFSSENPY